MIVRADLCKIVDGAWRKGRDYREVPAETGLLVTHLGSRFTGRVVGFDQAADQEQQRRDESDERHEQRVLEQVLAFFVASERLHEVHELHDILPFRVVVRRALERRNVRRCRV